MDEVMPICGKEEIFIVFSRSFEVGKVGIPYKLEGVKKPELTLQEQINAHDCDTEPFRTTSLPTADGTTRADRKVRLTNK
jgi:hypothetical protein